MPGFTGDVIVNIQCALETGPHYDGPVRELARYIAHGCQHLSGASDHTPALRRRMRQVEEHWLAQADSEGRLAPLTLSPMETRDHGS